MPCPSGWWPFGRCIVVFSFLVGVVPLLYCVMKFYFGVIILKIELRSYYFFISLARKNVNFLLKIKWINKNHYPPLRAINHYIRSKNSCLVQS